MLTGYPCQTQHPAPQIQQSPAGAGLESGSCCAAAKNFRPDRERHRKGRPPACCPGGSDSVGESTPLPRWSPPGTRRGRTATGAGGKAFSPAGRAQRPFWPKTGKSRSPNAKSPAEAGLEDRGAGAPTVELLKPELRRSTRRTGSRSRHHTRRCGHRRSQPWGSCPRCCGCRPATWRCRQRPA